MRLGNDPGLDPIMRDDGEALVDSWVVQAEVPVPDDTEQPTPSDRCPVRVLALLAVCGWLAAYGAVRLWMDLN
jgi:hypothetical protein